MLMKYKASRSTDAERICIREATIPALAGMTYHSNAVEGYFKKKFYEHCKNDASRSHGPKENGQNPR